jgi:hypothetical protein
MEGTSSYIQQVALTANLKDWCLTRQDKIIDPERWLSPSTVF